MLIKIHQLNIMKIIKKDYKQSSWKISLSKEEKAKKPQYDCEWYKNLPEGEKQKLVENRKKYYKMRKKHLFMNIRNYFHLENLQLF